MRSLPPQRIRELRKSLNLTQQQMANLIGVTNVSVCNWERGVYIPQSSQLKLLRELEAKAAHEAQSTTAS